MILAAFNRPSSQTWPDPAIKKRGQVLVLLPSPSTSTIMLQVLVILPSTSSTSTIRQVLVLKAGWAHAVWSIIISQCQWTFVFDMSHEAHKSACYNLKESISGCKMANTWSFRCCLCVHRITRTTCGRLFMYDHDHCMRFAFRKLHLFSHANAGSLLERLQGRPQWNSEQAHVWWLERWSETQFFLFVGVSDTGIYMCLKFKV